MRHKIFAPVVVMSALALGQQAHAGTLTISAINASVPGGGVITGNLTLTWGATTDAVYNSPIRMEPATRSRGSAV